MKFKLLLIGFFFWIGFIGTTTAQNTKIGFTNVELILAYMPEAKTVDKTLQTYSQQLEKSLMIKDQYAKTKLQEYYEKVDANRFQSQDAQKAAETELQKLNTEIQQAAQDSEYRLMAKQQELMQPLLDKLQTKINEIAKEGNYTYILNQTSGMNILYGVETMDVTSLLAAKLGISLPEKK